MYQLINLINRTNVAYKSKADFNSCDDFFHAVMTGHILVAAMEELGMENMHDTPSKAVVSSPNTAWMGTNEEILAILTDISESIARKYITISFNKRSTMSSGDGVYDYSRHLLTIECLYLEYKDAIKEGDGMRVLQCWKYLYQFFKILAEKNTIEAFKLLYQYYYGLPPRHAQQLLWIRFINTQGIHGKNIPMDLHQKHLNRVCKMSIEALGPNKRGEGIVRCSKALGTMQLMLENVDRDNTVGQTSDTHNIPSFKKDVYRKITDELQKTRVFQFISGWEHYSLKNPTNINMPSLLRTS